MSITYSQPGPGYEDASLGYNGDTLAEVSGALAVDFSSDDLAADAQGESTVTVTIS